MSAKRGGKAAPAAATMPAHDLVDAEWSPRRDLTGSGSGSFNVRLLNQLWRSLCAVGSRDPWHEELAQRAARGALAGIAPRDPLESMLAAQMLVVHDAAMEALRRANIPEQTFEGRQAALSQANKLVRSYATLLEALDRHRGKGQPQVVRVERVTVQSGGQAVVGVVGREGGGDGRGGGERSHAKALGHAPEPALWGEDPGREPVPVARGEGQTPV